MATRYIDQPVSELSPGDVLDAIGSIGVAPIVGASKIVVTARPVEGEDLVQIPTSVGDMTAPADTRVSFLRSESTPALLISRRPSLHSQILSMGEPVTRRTPVEDDDSAGKVTAAEWEAASLILIDGFLAQETLRGMWLRDEFTAVNKSIFMVGDDLDDARIYGRARAAYARSIALLPDHRDQLASLLHSIARDAAHITATQYELGTRTTAPITHLPGREVVLAQSAGGAACVVWPHASGQNSLTVYRWVSGWTERSRPNGQMGLSPRRRRSSKCHPPLLVLL